MRLLRAFLVLSLLLLPQMANAETLMMATTTSTQDTGLLEYLQPIFKKDTGIDLKWISVGTGKALAHGKDCDVDVLLVHAPALEEKFVADGFGVDRHQVMYNDFVLIGPAADPAGVKGKDIPAALKTFAEKKIPFVSRGDNSGTHNTEKQLWKVAGMEVPGKDATWYIDAGQGMMATIRIAAEKDGYTVTDRGSSTGGSAPKPRRPSPISSLKANSSSSPTPRPETKDLHLFDDFQKIHFEFQTIELRLFITTVNAPENSLD